MANKIKSTRLELILELYVASPLHHFSYIVLNAYHKLAFKQSMSFYVVSLDFLVTEFMVEQ